MNVAQSIERGAQLFPTRPALHVEGVSFSYAQLHHASNQAANVFTRLGVAQGDRVALLLPNSAAFVIAYLGVQKVGAVAVTVNTALKADEVDFILKDSGAQLLLTTAPLYAALDGIELAPLRHLLMAEGEVAGSDSFTALCQAAAVDYATQAMQPAEPAAILYTSGTTGFPKGALLSHHNIVSSAETAVTTFGLQPTDRILLPLSTFHSFAQTAALIPCFTAGATLILHRQFEVEPVLRSIQAEQATIFFGVPTLYILLYEHATPTQLQSVRRYISAGTSLPVTVAHNWQAKYGRGINEGYGLTEVCLATFNTDPHHKPGSVGQALVGMQVQIVNRTAQALPPGELGEVVVAGPSVMLGYWQRPVETAAVLANGWFHTGDIGRLDEAGNLYIVDRVKDMVNVGGVKVYPSEVEHVLYQHPAVSEAAVYGVLEPLLGEAVHASVVLKRDQHVTAQALLAFCRQRLADFKVPGVVQFVEQLPKSRTGKILKRFLRDQAQTIPPEPTTDQGHAQPPLPTLAGTAPGQQGEAIAQWLVTWLAQELGIEPAVMDWDCSFAEYGLTSVMAVNLARALGEWLGEPIQAILLWNFPTIRTMVQHLHTTAGQRQTAPAAPTPTGQRDATSVEPIAVIGIGCRLPGGANTPEQFWQLLHNGVDTTAPIPATRWSVDDYYDPNPSAPGKMVVRAGSFLPEVDRFDAHFFGISPLEAATLDPQQRLLLEVSWEALEHANLAADSLRESRTGVYVGAFWDDYSAQHLYNADPAQIDGYRLLSHLRGMSAGRLAYVLGLHGPAMQLDTACSSSLLALHLASQALRAGECDLALAGGVNLVLSPEQLIGLSQMGAVAPDGRCKTFAAEADGFGVGEGAGIVVLKRLADARRAGDHIFAVIRGSAVNHDGASNGLTAPNGRAQEAMLRQAVANAGVHPTQIQYVETHGTGTVLGDPIEVQALVNVLGPGRTTPLMLGSVKTNIGHLSAAAGIAAFIKVVLALQEGMIPPNLHFTTPNPHIPWTATELIIPTTPTAWPAAAGSGKGRRLAGVSSFGLTGTNVHLIVEEAPPAAPHTSPPKDAAPLTADEPLERPYHLLTLSAKSEAALQAQLAQIDRWLADAPAVTLADLCYTAATSRSHWSERLSMVAPDLATLQAKVRQAQGDPTVTGVHRSKKGDVAPKLAFLFPGQGPQYVGMGRQLYATQPHFRRTIQECDEILRAHLDRSLVELLYGADQAQADLLLNEATYAQPALFAIEYALATLWRSWGIVPTVLIGHSLGEYAAACVAGVFSLADGLTLVATRGRLMQTQAPKGQMVAVLGPAARVHEILQPYAQTVALAAINTPESVVIAGSPASIHQAVAALTNAGLKTRPLKIYVASHSPLMAPILDAFTAVAATVTYHRPQLPIISNVTGAPADVEVTTPDYWRRHLREPVHFAQGIATISTLGIDAFIEVGPKATLLGLAQQCVPHRESQLWLPTIHPQKEDWVQIMESLAALYGSGAAIDWQGFDQEYRRQKVNLPRYPFQRQRYWLDASKAKAIPARPATTSAPAQAAPGGHPLLGRPIVSAVAARNQERLFENRLELGTLAYLADHALFDQPLLPGAAYLEMILAAGAHVWGTTSLRIADCALQQGLFLPTPEASDTPSAGVEQYTAPTVQVIFTPAEASYRWQIYSLPGDGQPTDPWTLHATGSVMTVAAPVQPAPVDLVALCARCQTVIDVSRYAQKLHEQGITYGPAFQALTQLWVGEDEALGYLTLPQALTGATAAYHLHPVLLDAALRVASSFLPDDAADPYLPFSIDEVQLFIHSSPAPLWSHVQQRSSAADVAAGTLRVDLTLLNAHGDTVARLINFTLRRANRAALLGQPRRLDWLYTLTWQPALRPTTSAYVHTAGAWLILADRQGRGAELAKQLSAQGEQCHLLYQEEQAEQSIDAALFRLLAAKAGQSTTPQLRGVVYLWGLDTLAVAAAEVPAVAVQLSSQLLHLVQALLATKQTPRLWLVTQQAVDQQLAAPPVQQAPLWGLGRTLHWEQPELACTCLDLTAELTAEALFQEIWWADQENQIRLRGGARLAARLVRHRAPTASPLKLRADGSYLVTGGLGGLGLAVAQWLVRQGARHLILTGRRGAATPAAHVAIQAMIDAGAGVSVVQADIAQAADVQRLIAGCQAVAPLRGIIHAAGVIDDGLLRQQTAARFAQVMAAKVAGSWHLHTLTCDLPLDFFICFSSVSSLLGNSGQSNYAAANAFMDALAHHRQAAGQPALSINWGGWAEVGLAAELVKQTIATGLGAITPAQGVDLLGLLMTQRAPQVGVLPLQWRAFEQALPNPAAFPVLAELLEARAAQRVPSRLRQRQITATAAERDEQVKTLVYELLQQLLGATPAPDESFLRFGLDSLLSIQLANRLAAALGIRLPATLAFTYETIDQLIPFLLATLAGAANATADPHPAQAPTPPLLDAWQPQLYNQQECFIWHETATNQAALHIPQAIRIHSPVDGQLLAAALQALVDRHEALRTVYTRREGKLVQRILPTQTVDFAIVDMAQDSETVLAAALLAAARHPFDLAHGPLLRGRLFSRATDEHLLLLVVHHIAADATALSVLINELWPLYAGLQSGKLAPLPPISATWQTFVHWQTTLLQSEAGEQLWHYWQTQLRGAQPHLALPTDYPRPVKDSHHGQPCPFTLEAELTHHLRQLAQQEGCTLYMVLMTGFQLLLHLYTQQRDILVAAHVANRNEAQFAATVGYLADTFPIRTQIPAGATVQSVLHQVQPTIRAAMEHQGFPMRLMAERLEIQEDPSRPLLCQVWFTLLPLRLFQESGALFQQGNGVVTLGGLQLEATDILPAWLGAWYDLEMILTEGPAEVFGTLVYKSDLFAAATIQQLIVDFQALLQAMIADPSRAVGVDLLTHHVTPLPQLSSEQLGKRRS